MKAFIDDVLKTLPEIPGELQKLVKEAIQAQIEKHGLVTREELDRHLRLLHHSREKLMTLEAKLNDRGANNPPPA